MPKQELVFRKPICNVAGSMGFFPDHRQQDLVTEMGAFFTHPISRHHRVHASARYCLSFTGGFLLHTGFPNPGLRKALQHYHKRWMASSIPVIIHLMADGTRDALELLKMVEGAAGIAGSEVSFPPGTGMTEYEQFTSSLVSEMPVILQVPAHQLGQFAAKFRGSDLTALSMAAPRGALPHQNSLITGRISGPSIYPQTLLAVKEAVPFGTPIIASGGLYMQEQIDLLLGLGVLAVQLDAALWMRNWQAASETTIQE